MSHAKEKTKIRLWAILIIIVAVILGAFDYPQSIDRGVDWTNAKLGTSFPHVYNLPFHLGLDLQGGTHLVYEADVSKIASNDIASSVEGVRDVIERRINSLGVAEPIIQVNKAGAKWRVIVELAGIKDVNEAIKMIGETPLLEFKEQNTEPARQLTAQEKKDMEAYNKEIDKKAKDLLTQAKDGADFATLVLENTEEETTKATGGDLGFIKASDLASQTLYNKLSDLNPAKDTVLKDLVTDNETLQIVKVLDTQDGGQQIKASHILICYNGATSCTSELTKEQAQVKIADLKTQATASNFSKLAKENSTEPGADTSGGDLGWFAQGVMVESFEKTAFALEKGQVSDVVETDFGFHLIYKEDERQTTEYRVAHLVLNKQTEADILPPTDPWKNTGLSGKNLKKSLVNFDSNTNIPEVGLEFDDEGAKLFGEITSRNVGKMVAIYLDGEPLSVPRVNQAITDGSAVIQGDFTVQEAKLLSQRLNSGALPVPINLVSQQTVGASLGAESLNKSLFAGLIGLILVMLFMIFFYRLPGVLAVISLLVYSVILLFLFKIIPVTLTLSGIAGFILSLGMAVDANVLIFERMKEELRLGKPLASAVDEGFKRAWPSIRDGNASTLITCFILAWFGTSMIKGFAITLGIGVMMSMLSAIVVTRVLLKLFATSKKLETPLFFLGIKKVK